MTTMYALFDCDFTPYDGDGTKFVVASESKEKLRLYYEEIKAENQELGFHNWSKTPPLIEDETFGSNTPDAYYTIRELEVI